MLKANLCSLSGEIDDLAYISTSEYRFDGQDKSVVCTVSSDGTVRAWDLHEVSCLGGGQDECYGFCCTCLYVITSLFSPYCSL